MKTTLKLTLLTGLLLGLVACSSSDKTKEQNNTTPTEQNTTASPSPSPAVQQTQKMPECGIYKGTPTTDSMITVHVRCKNGNIPIDEATVTLDGTVKRVDKSPTYFSDYIGFRNLQPSTMYKAVLEVLVGGKTIKRSVKIKTEKEKVVVTQTPPKWKKKVYEVHRGLEDIENNKINLNLQQEVSSEQRDKITYKVLSNSYKILDDSTCISDQPFVESKSIKISGDKLIVAYSPPCVGVITSIVQAKSKGGVSNATIKIYFEPTPWMPIGNTPPVWTKDTYYKTITENDYADKIKILQLDNICSDNEGDKIDFKISSIDTSKFVSHGCLPIVCPEGDTCDDYTLDNFWIENNILFTSTSSLDLSCQYGEVSVLIKAEAIGGVSQATVNVLLHDAKK